jgi:hypothetical protein
MGNINQEVATDRLLTVVHYQCEGDITFANLLRFAKDKQFSEYSIEPARLAAMALQKHRNKS